MPHTSRTSLPGFQPAPSFLGHGTRPPRDAERDTERALPYAGSPATAEGAVGAAAGVVDRAPAQVASGAECGGGRPPEANNLLRLLARDAREEYDELLRSMEPLALDREDVLYEAGGPMSYVYFPRTSVASIVKVMADGRRVEVGTTGFDGMVGLGVFLGADSTPFRCFVQIPGSAWRVRAGAFADFVARGSALHAILQRYAQYQFDQTAHSAACNRLHGVDARCARWLAMTHDRVHRADRFPLTQEFLAVMLGVRRASVSVAAEALQDAGLIRYRRGSISVLDRAGLEAAACECYHTDRADYERLLG